MEPTHLPRTCKWSTLTLLTPWPSWLNAWTKEWTCMRDGVLRPFDQSAQCKTCRRWESTESTGASQQS